MWLLLCILFIDSYTFSVCSLDTFPYAGTTTTCESLYMGVPCITMAGSVHAHNVGVSLLGKVGEEVPHHTLINMHLVSCLLRVLKHYCGIFKHLWASCMGRKESTKIKLSFHSLTVIPKILNVDIF